MEKLNVKVIQMITLFGRKWNPIPQQETRQRKKSRKLQTKTKINQLWTPKAKENCKLYQVEVAICAVCEACFCVSGWCFGNVCNMRILGVETIKHVLFCES